MKDITKLFLPLVTFGLILYGIFSGDMITTVTCLVGSIVIGILGIIHIMLADKLNGDNLPEKQKPSKQISGQRKEKLTLFDALIFGFLLEDLSGNKKKK